MSGNVRIETVRGDLVEQTIDAVVNAANTALAGGGGVDGAIHEAAGPELAAACRAFRADARGVRCPTGEVRVTPAFGVSARCILHAVGPVWDSRQPAPCDELLRLVHVRALQAAVEHGCRSIAFPALSTGAFRFPVTRAAAVAVDAVADFLAGDDRIELVRFVLFSDGDLRVFQNAVRARYARKSP